MNNKSHKVHHLSLAKKNISDWIFELQFMIIKEFEQIERECQSNAIFKTTDWKYERGSGGGKMAVMKGEVFEKVGVHVSVVDGQFDEHTAKSIPGTEEDRSFTAAGISIIAHMKSPMVPAAHMNTRMISTQQTWFGGGADLTPTFEFEEDTELFHQKLKEACDSSNPEYYNKFKKQCEEYFFLKHRNESRGVGGIFYDYLNSGALDDDITFTKNVGCAFLKAFVSIIRKRYKVSWDQEQKRAQLIKRGRYVEFNLLYDRGTLFGLKTGGNIDSILSSMPPEVIWE